MQNEVERKTRCQPGFTWVHLWVHLSFPTGSMFRQVVTKPRREKTSRSFSAVGIVRATVFLPSAHKHGRQVCKLPGGGLHPGKCQRNMCSHCRDRADNGPENAIDEPWKVSFLFGRLCCSSFLRPLWICFSILFSVTLRAGSLP